SSEHRGDRPARHRAHASCRTSSSRHRADSGSTRVSAAAACARATANAAAPPPVVPTPAAAPVAPATRRPAVGQELVVGSLGYLVPDGAGKQPIGDAATAVLTQDPL